MQIQVNTPLPICVTIHAEFGRSALRRVRVNTVALQNWGALEFRFLGMGGVADPKIHAPPTYVLPRQIW